MRILVAQEAARIVLEGGVRNLGQAKRKAAARLGVSDSRILPDQDEIEHEILARQRLFQPQTHQDDQAALRRDALEAMRLLRAFNPYLTGRGASGSAGPHDAVELLLYTDTPESVGWTLDAQGIPAELGERRLRFGGDARVTAYPCYRFLAGERRMELIVLPERSLHQTPLSQGQPLPRLSFSKVQAG